MPSKVLDELSKKSDEHEFYSNFPKNYRKGKTKYIVVTGSVISGVGKGTVTSSIGNLLKLLHGFKVAPVKFDGYLNCDAGTLNPFRHGEVFVLDDGTECDLDLGTYERMLNENFTKDNYLTSGKIFKMIIDKERAGKYLGRDVQFIPHVTGEIKGFLRKLAMKSGAEIILVEVGGTVGDIENSYFLEAMRELAYEEGRENVCFINVTYAMKPNSLGEHKSKAAQLGIKSLMSMGIQPDIIICRSETSISEKIKEKISVYSNVPVSRVINSSDVSNIYKIPLYLKKMGVDASILDILKLKRKGKGSHGFGAWKRLVSRIDNAKKEVVVAIAGKYTTVHDSYLSILKALEHTAPYFDVKVRVKWIETTDVETGKVKIGDAMKDVNGLIVPGGFGLRGTEGMIACVKYAREKNMPFLGLCFGFQMAVIEFARNVCGIKNSDSSEFCPETENAVICILPEQEEIEELGGTMRLGGLDLKLKERSIAHRLYGKLTIRERFRHRYNVNTKYIQTIESKGMIFSGFAPKKRIMQILELPKHRFFMATQFHPELSSKPLEPNPMFRGFLKACVRS
jgi:CTP synthase